MGELYPGQDVSWKLQGERDSILHKQRHPLQPWSGCKPLERPVLAAATLVRKVVGHEPQVVALDCQALETGEGGVGMVLRLEEERLQQRRNAEA